MDASVLRSMARWPNVPALYGWLVRDHRGQFLLKGEPITNANSIAFLKRHFLCDARGCYYFQNGPQRVFVALQTSPQCFQIQGQQWVGDQGPLAELTAMYLDEDARIFVRAGKQVGHLDDRDLVSFVDGLCDRNGVPIEDSALDDCLAWQAEGSRPACYYAYAGRIVPIEYLSTENLPSQLGFVKDPEP